MYLCKILASPRQEAASLKRKGPCTVVVLFPDPTCEDPLLLGRVWAYETVAQLPLGRAFAFQK